MGFDTWDFGHFTPWGHIFYPFPLENIFINRYDFTADIAINTGKLGDVYLYNIQSDNTDRRTDAIFSGARNLMYRSQI